MAQSFEELIKKLKASGQAPAAEPEEKRANPRGPVLIDLKDPKVYRLRILANLNDVEDVPFVQHFIHLGFVHPNFGKITPLVCKGPHCPLCEYYRRRHKGGDDQAWKFKCNTRWLYYVLFINKDGEEEIGLLSVNFYAHEDIKNKIINQLKSKINVFDLAEGYWLTIDVVKIDKKTKLAIGVDTDPHRISPATEKKLDSYKRLDKIYKDFDYTAEQLKKILKGEKLTLAGSNSPGGAGPEGAAKKPAPTIKKAEPKINMSFASDEVDSIDDPAPNPGRNVLEKPAAEPVPDNLRRLSDILSDDEEE